MTTNDLALHGPIAWMARNPVAANLLMMLLLVGGILTFTSITQEVFPSLTQDEVNISVAYPGSSPADIEKGIVLVIEETLRGLDGVGEVTSQATEGNGAVTAEILDGAEPMKVYQDIRSEIDRIRTFPEDAEDARVSLSVRRRNVLSVVLYGSTTETSLASLAEGMRDLLLAEENITQIDLEGIRPYEISIEVPQAQLRRYHLTLSDVAARLARTSVELPGGGIKTETGEILLRVQERRDYGREFARTPIWTGPDGSQVLLESIATVTDGFEDSDRYATYNGKPAVMLEVYRVGEQTPTQVAAAVDKALAEARRDLPAGIGIEVLNSRADIFAQRANLLLRNGAIGLLLVFLLLGVFLEARLSFWVMMGIPISFLGSMLLMPMFGLSINMITMFAYILALGIVVDDAIVVGENIYHYRQDGQVPLRAAILGAREVCVPVGFSILTNIVAFIPLLLLPGMMGKVLGMLPLVVISVFAISWVESLLVLPAHLGHQKDRQRRGAMAWLHGRQQAFSHGFRAWVNTRYRAFLERCLSARYFVVAIALAILILTLGYWKSGRMGFSLFTTVESDYAEATPALPFGSPIERTGVVADHMVRAAQAVVREAGHAELVEGIFADVGRGEASQARIRVYLAPSDVRDKIMSTQQFVQKWRQKVGEVVGVKFIRYLSDSGGPGGGPALTVELRHRDIATLENASRELAEALQDFPLVLDVDDGVQRGKRQMDFSLTPEARSLSLTSYDVGRQIRGAFEGVEVLRQQRGRNEVKVKVRWPEAERRTEFGVENLLLRTPAGTDVPLREAVMVKESRAYTTINRRNGQRTLTLTADVRPKTKAGEVQSRLDRETMPELQSRHPGLQYSYEGRAAEGRKSFDSMAMTIPMVLIGIYALLAVPFKSYTQPLIVMVSIPFGVVGAVLGHVIMGYSMTMIGVIGMIALSGVVVNDALVLISFANSKREEQGNAHDAVVAAGIQRFRPILLTTLTTFGGLAPMIFETSRQARFLIPMALSLGYGLLFATLINLVLVPALYMILDDVHRRLGAKTASE